MLPKNKRLNLKADFKWVTSGKLVENNLVTLFYKIGDNTLSRVGVSLSSKTFPSAISRNMVKRLVFNGFKNLYPRVVKHVNIVAIPKVGILGLDSAKVTKELEVLLKDSSLLI